MHAAILALVLLGQFPDNPFQGERGEDIIPVMSTKWEGIASKATSFIGNDHLVVYCGLNEVGESIFNYVYFNAQGNIRIFHDSDPLRACDIEDCEGRRVSFDTHDKVVTIIGGIHPHDYKLAVKKARERPGDNADRFMNCMVNKGMSSASYQTRKAASNVMRRRGAEAIPALIAGLDSKDCEVRDRCKAVLYAIQTGIYLDD